MKYTLTVSTFIHADDYDDYLEGSYPCTYTCENGIHRLKYDDKETGFNVVKILPDGEIQIRRRSSFSIILRKGYSHRVDHETPYGSIPMQFELISVEGGFSPQGGHLIYRANIYIDGTKQTNHVTMALIPSERND